MVTVVNNPAPEAKSDGGTGMIVGVLLILVMGILFYLYGLPAINNMQSPQINIPNKIDVNVKQE